MTLSLPLATAVITAVAVIGVQIIAGVGGVSQAQGDGDLLLDWAIDDNGPTSVGVVDTECQSFSAGTLVQIDVIAVNAVDWAGMDFVLNYPSPAVVTRPGRGDGAEGGGFDFLTFPTGAFGAQNFMFPDSTDINADYSTTEAVADSASPHGVSMFDNSLAGNSGSGAMARMTLDTTADLAPGVYTLSLGVTPAFAGGVHSDGSGLQPDSFGSVQFAVDTDCPTGPAGPTPTSVALLPTEGSGTADGSGWLTVLYVAGGIIAAAAAVGVIYLRVRRRAVNK